MHKRKWWLCTCLLSTVLGLPPIGSSHVFDEGGFLWADVQKIPNFANQMEAEDPTRSIDHVIQVLESLQQAGHFGSVVVESSLRKSAWASHLEAESDDLVGALLEAIQAQETIAVPISLDSSIVPSAREEPLNFFIQHGATLTLHITPPRLTRYNFIRPGDTRLIIQIAGNSLWTLPQVPGSSSDSQSVTVDASDALFVPAAVTSLGQSALRTGADISIFLSVALPHPLLTIHHLLPSLLQSNTRRCTCLGAPLILLGSSPSNVLQRVLRCGELCGGANPPRVDIANLEAMISRALRGVENKAVGELAGVTCQAWETCASRGMMGRLQAQSCECDDSCGCDATCGGCCGCDGLFGVTRCGCDCWGPCTTSCGCDASCECDECSGCYHAEPIVCGHRVTDVIQPTDGPLVSQSGREKAFEFSISHSQYVSFRVISPQATTVSLWRMVQSHFDLEARPVLVASTSAVLDTWLALSTAMGSSLARDWATNRFTVTVTTAAPSQPAPFTLLWDTCSGNECVEMDAVCGSVALCADTLLAYECAPCPHGYPSAAAPPQCHSASEVALFTDVSFTTVTADPTTGAPVTILLRPHSTTPAFVFHRMLPSGAPPAMGSTPFVVEEVWVEVQSATVPPDRTAVAFSSRIFPVEAPLEIVRATVPFQRGVMFVAHLPASLVSRCSAGPGQAVLCLLSVRSKVDNGEDTVASVAIRPLIGEDLPAELDEGTELEALRMAGIALGVLCCVLLGVLWLRCVCKGPRKTAAPFYPLHDPDDMRAMSRQRKSNSKRSRKRTSGRSSDAGEHDRPSRSEYRLTDPPVPAVNIVPVAEANPLY